MEKGSQSEGLLAGNSIAQGCLVFCEHLLQDWHRLIAPHQDVIRIQMARNRWACGLPVPHRLHRARPAVLAIPQEVGHTAANLHARKTFVQLGKVHDASQVLIGKHLCPETIQTFAARHPA